MRIAIVGSGVSGLVCSHLLRGEHDVTLYEAEARAGGHANTVAVNLEGVDYAVDTGFIVYNERNYPVITNLFDELGVRTRPSDMSFAMSDDAADIEWCGTSLNSVFAQRRNLLRPVFWRMLRDVVRFNRSARAFLAEPENLGHTLAEFLEADHYSSAFIDWYLVPMGAAIWSADPESFLRFPAAAFIRFFNNHGLLGVRDRPEWRSVVGGSVRYVEAITSSLGNGLRLGVAVRSVARRGDEVAVISDEGVESYDHVIIATHSDQALALLDSPTVLEREVLSALAYSSNEATLHTDERLMPRRRRARASWNWRRRPGARAATLTYDLSRLQGLATPRPLYLTLNQADAVDPDQVLARITYQHPIFDSSAMAAQRRHAEISGRDRISYVGAYWGFGFHEDGARSAVDVCRSLGVAVPEGVS